MLYLVNTLNFLVRNLDHVFQTIVCTPKEFWTQKQLIWALLSEHVRKVDKSMLWQKTRSRSWEYLSSVFFCGQICKVHVQFSSVQSLSRVRLFATPWTAACRASLSITSSRSLPKLMPIELVMPSKHLILCHPLFVRDILNITDFILEYVLSYKNLVLTISKLLLVCFILIY